MQIQRTPHGFDCKAATTLRPAPLADGPRAWLRPWSCAKIECLAPDARRLGILPSPCYQGVSFRNI